MESGKSKNESGKLEWKVEKVKVENRSSPVILCRISMLMRDFPNAFSF